jgi:hypothetical protein
MDKIEDENIRTTIGFRTLDRWLIEMNDCMSVGSENKSIYYNTVAEIAQFQFVRVGHFIDRHHLWNQFYTEDAQGKR